METSCKNSNSGVRRLGNGLVESRRLGHANFFISVDIKSGANLRRI